jgi:heme oxygenase
MSNLKELTAEQHSNAERQEFVKILFSGQMEPELYAQYLYNQFPMYELLEVMAMQHGLVSDMPEILRSKAIWSDFEELWPTDRKEFPKECPVVKKYLDHIISIKDDPTKLMAHIYVRHMGDLAGGQMIAKKVPGSGNYYKFENAHDLKIAVRSKISDDMAEEAKVCFEFATQFFKEMMEHAK